MSKKLTYEYVKEYIESFNYKLISDTYIDTTQYIIVECDKGHQYSVKFGNFKSGKRCPECAKLKNGNQRRLQYDFVKNEIEKSGELKLLSKEYKNNTTPLLIQCKNGHIFNKLYSSLQRNMACPECAKEIIRKDLAFSYEEVKKYVESEGYKLLSSDYKNASLKIKLQCPEGHIYDTKYNNFRNGKRCRKCSMKKLGDKKRFTLEQVKKFIESVDGYKLLSTKYINASKKLNIKCPQGHVFPCSYNKFRDGQRCPICQESKGEAIIRNYYDNKNINYITQYSFDDCKNIEPLRYDFAVFKDENKTQLVFLCEYDGEFHYKPILGKRKLKYQQKLDNIKNTYCKDNNIPLLRIPYWEFDNIEKILKEELLKYNLID